MDWNAIQGRLGSKVDGSPGHFTYLALIEIVGKPNDGVADALAAYAVHYEMTTPARLAEFIAQIANETGGFRVWVENLKYGVAGMLKTFPAHFNQELANWAFGHEDRVAEVAYGVKSKTGHGRMGNSRAGDGYLYRGRGALQLTGKNNYSKFGNLLNLDLVGHPELAAEPFVSTRIALEFFRLGKVNDAVDAGDFKLARKITNGGAIGLPNVAKLRGKLLAVLE